MPKAALERLEHICYTIIRNNAIPSGIQIISRNSLNEYNGIDFQLGEKDEQPKDRKNESNGITLTKLMAKRILQDYKNKTNNADFAFNSDFTRDEKNFIRE